MKKIIVVILFPLIFISCEDLLNTGKPENEYSIFFNLKVNSGKQKFFIYRISNLKENENAYDLKDYDKYFVEDAKIFIESENKIYNNFFQEMDTNGVRYYTIDNIDLLPGLKYDLKINIHDQVITGSTIIPQVFEIINPKEDQIVPYLNNKFEIEIKWNKSNNALGYIIDISYPFYEPAFDKEFIAYFNESLFDTTYKLIGNYKPSNKVLIKILAFDHNYYKHIFNGVESSVVNGAYGYFGSSVLRNVNFFVE